MFRFRQHHYAIMADIESMYHQVKIPVHDRDVLRFPWRNEDGDNKRYRMTSHIFGGIWCASRLQTTQPTSGGAVTVVSSCCANCVESPRPQQWGPDLPFFGHAGHADPLDGWRCCSQKRVMSRPIQVRQL